VKGKQKRKERRNIFELVTLLFLYAAPTLFSLHRVHLAFFAFSNDLALAFFARMRETPMSSCCSSSSRSGTVNTERFSPSMCLHEEEKPANKVKKHIDGESYHDLNLETTATLITNPLPAQ
jgi:hypothetical protein